MSTHDRVIVGVDGSPASRTALSYAAEQADRRGLPLHLVNVFLSPAVYGLTPYVVDVEDSVKAAQVLVDGMAAEVRTEWPRLSVDTSVIIGGPAGALTGLSREARLLVVGSRGLGGFTELLLGSVSAQVAAHAHCPVVVVRPVDPAQEGARATTAPVVVGVDGSAANEPAIEFAFAEAARRGLPLVALHAWWAPEHGGLGAVDRSTPSTDDAEREAARLTAEALAGWRAEYPEVVVESQLTHSLNPEATLVDASSWAGLMVVGSRGRGGFAGLLLGSVSQALIHHAHCPVAVVRPAQR